MTNPITVAIIGGGISGLVCASRLSQLGHSSVTVFDTGKNSVGGRCSSRDITINGQLHIFDHSAQYFTVSDPKFAKIVSFLHKKGAVKVWKRPSVGRINKNGIFVANQQLSQAFIGTNGMKSIPETLCVPLNIKRPVWIGSVNWEASLCKWKVDRHGYFDYLVIAHNGKCADKLMAGSGVPKIHSLLRVRFGEQLVSRDTRMQLCSQWVLLVAFEQSLGLKFQGAHVECNTSISWIANNTAKLNDNHETQKSASKLECWTIFSTRSFGTKHKVPQENISLDKEDEVTNALLVAFSILTKIPKTKLKPCYTKVQLWGAAVPMNVLRNGDQCVFDGEKQVGVCGDWLVSPCIQGAALSGLALAEKITHALGRNDISCVTRMDACFIPSQGEEIGAFPNNPNLIFKAAGV